VAGGVVILPDDLAQVVNAERFGAGRGERIVDRSVRATAVEEAVGAAKVTEQPDNLARTVDAPGTGTADGQGSVEGGIGIDWHDAGSSASVSLAESIESES